VLLGGIDTARARCGSWSGSAQVEEAGRGLPRSVRVHEIASLTQDIVSVTQDIVSATQGIVSATQDVVSVTLEDCDTHALVSPSMGLQ
jgi:hypothetical protein